MTDESEKPEITPEAIRAADAAVDKAGAHMAEKLGEVNPELALKTGEPKQNYVKMAVDYGPIILFGLTLLISNLLKIGAKDDRIIYASAALGVASVVALVAGLALEKRIAWIPLVSCLLSVPFSILTVIFHNPTFIEVKMTILDALIGAILIGGLLLKKQPLKALLGESLKLKDAAWPRLTLYYALFYFAMAAINEFVRRAYTTDIWATWKIISIVGGPVVLTLALLPFLMKNLVTEPDADEQV
ncbi:septation protein IspZ [Asticcacaulis sp. EMRT-3]|uniref:inner membrane-spanning protein YciB n=1 Tax=Asticcacaulis sp. EMRT-3 TaxID=3040349 RepID=UPI0024AF5D7F|nr:septation protein IspZ [Asticcacaulis sp. EMRT-3]MDI7775909.1 septation protein IspZ [Asticcacaulis sp. EMRT-3]